MAFRKRRHDSEGDSDEEKLPIARDDDDDLKAEPAKKSKNIWSDMLLEEQLLEKGQKINLDKLTKKQPNIMRGPESYVMPPQEFERKKNKPKGKKEDADAPVVLVTPASDDLFGDAPGAPTEHFGVKKNETKVAPDFVDEGWWGKKGASKKFNAERGHFDPREPRKPPVMKKTSQLMTEEFSLDAMLAVEFAENLELEQFANELAAAMGEKDPDTIKKIVNAIGREVSLKLFNETKEIEKNGGMKTADGSRRRTPGGVFITLFKMDTGVSREVKNSIFGDMRNAGKERTKNKKKAQNFTKKLEDMKKTMDLAAKAEDDLANEELGVAEAPFDDNVVDMV